MTAREPVQVLYGGAHRFRADTCRKMGTLALRSLSESAPNPAALAAVLGILDEFAETVYERVLEKLNREPVEDFHIDFEDGFGVRSDTEEDNAARSAAEQVAAAMDAQSMPPFSGIRIKPLNAESRLRGLRTLKHFLDVLFLRSGGRAPRNFVITLPKITVPEEIAGLVEALAPYPPLAIEVMIETTQALMTLPSILRPAQGRCVAAHFGPYDYTASLGITAPYQSLQHPACDFARNAMQVSLAGTGIRLVDGPTNTLPLGTGVHRGWKLHYDDVRRALARGFYQSWDLHPAQLVSHYAAVYSFFLEGKAEASRRLRNFVEQSAQATQIAGHFDDAATGLGLINYFLRAVNCGAILETEVPALTGLSMESLRAGKWR
jgi:citrate lyase beta subunit